MKLAALAFKERPLRHGNVGDPNPGGPTLGDRFLALTHGDIQISVGHASRIVSTIESTSTTRYELADNTIITAPAGARITWEEQ